MNDQKRNKQTDCLPSTFRFKSEPESISLNDNQYYDLIEKIDYHLDLLERTPKITSVFEFKTLFQSEILGVPSLIDFYSLDQETKTFISMIHVSAKYLRHLENFDFNVHADLLREHPSDPNDIFYDPSFIRHQIDSMNQTRILKELAKKPHRRAKKIKLISEKDFEYLSSYRHDSTDLFPKITQKSSTLYRNLSNQFSYPLQIEFNRIVSIKHSFLFLLEQFHRIIGQIKHLNFSDNTYNQLYDSVTKENYESFRSIIDDCNREIVNELTDIVVLFYPTLISIETSTTEQTFEYISKDLYHKDSPLKFEFSFVGAILIILVNYILINSIANHLDYFERQTLVDSFGWFYSPNTNTYLRLIDWSYYMNWINNGTEAIIDFFDDNQGDGWIVESKKETENNSINSEQKPIVDAPKPEQPESSSTNLKDDGKIEPPMDPEPEVETPRHLYVPYSYDMLLKLAEGLVCGFSVESSGKHKPLVESKVHEGNNTKIKKIICLFSGVGINDESLRWPYNLKWTGKANSLKLLVYLLHYEGKLEDPLKAIDEDDDEGISEIIRTSFKGTPVWNIVGTALGYKKDSLRTTNKIPRRSNIKLMEELAKLWFECKKIDD